MLTGFIQCLEHAIFQYMHYNYQLGNQGLEKLSHLSKARSQQGMNF